jgi:hypothetical protein
LQTVDALARPCRETPEPTILAGPRAEIQGNVPNGGRGAGATVHGPSGDWSIFRREGAFRRQTLGRKMDLSPLARGGQSHFRGERASLQGIVHRAAKIGTVPATPPPRPRSWVLDLGPIVDHNG